MILKQFLNEPDWKSRVTLFVAVALCIVGFALWPRLPALWLIGSGGFVLTGLFYYRMSRLFTAQQKAIEALERQRAKLLEEQTLRTQSEMAETDQRHLAEALQRIGVALSATRDFDELLERLLDQISGVLPYDTANIMLVAGSDVEIVCTKGYQYHAPYTAHFQLEAFPSLQKMRESSQPLIISNTWDHLLWVKPETSPHVRSWAGAPILVQGELVAFLALNHSQPNTYREVDLERLEAFAVQAAIAIQNTQLYGQIQKKYDEQATLNTISHAVASTLDLQKTLKLITDHTTRLLDVDATSVVLYDRLQGDLWFAAASGDAAAYVFEKRIQLGQGVLGWVALHGEAIIVEDVENDERYFPDFDEKSGFKTQSIVCVPLKTMGQTIGSIEIINKRNGRFNEEDVRLLSLIAAPAASAIENAQLYEQAQEEIQNRARVEKDLEAEQALLTRRVEERTVDLSSANAELARAARLKDEFLASISHELRTPLNAVLGISEALQEEVYGPLNEKQIGSLRSIEESGRHLLSLINDILDLSKVEAGKLDLEIRPCSLRSICESSLRLTRQNAHTKRLKVRFDFDETVNMVHADERRIKQILVNLLSNATKFTLAGGEIGIDVVGDVQKRQVHVTVWDTGIGVAKEDMSRLFRPFVQLDSRLSREFAGTGLGLSLVYRMVELHGGSVSVESEVGVGSRFTVSFPWQGPEWSFTPLDKAELVAADAPRLSSFRRALIVEDSPAATAQLIRYLSEMGIETSTSVQGHGVVEKVILEQPDVIILDVILPDISGWEILRQLKEEPPTRRIPVLVTSVVDDLHIALEKGASAILEKPIHRQKFQSALRQMLVEQIKNQRDTIFDDLTRLKTAVSIKHILVVEDNEANIQTVSDYLNAKHYHTSVARTGDTVMQMIETGNPDLILMDIQLPKRNGLDVIREIRQKPSLRSLPIIAVTALAMPGDQEACLRAGANGYISKPIVLKELVDLIETIYL